MSWIGNEKTVMVALSACCVAEVASCVDLAAVCEPVIGCWVAGIADICLVNRDFALGMADDRSV